MTSSLTRTRLNTAHVSAAWVLRAAMAVFAGGCSLSGSCGGQISNRACPPGATQTCVGAGQCAGVQVCNEAGTIWGSCSCENRTCSPGATQACLGSGRCAGAQVCNEAGSMWRSCDCGSPSEVGAGAPEAGAVASGSGPLDASGGSANAKLLTGSCTATVLFSPISLYGGKSAGLALDRAGNLFVAENTNNLGVVPDGPFVSKITPDGSRTIFVGRGLFGGVTALTFDANGYLYVADGIGNPTYYMGVGPAPTPRNLVWRVDPQGNATEFATNINNPTGLAFDSSGTLYVASFGDRAVYRFSPTGAPLGVFVSGLAFGPYGIALDASGNLFVTEHGTPAPTDGSRIDKVTPLGQLSTFVNAAPLRSPADLLFDGAGNLYASYYNGLKILRIAPNGSYTIFPGGCSGDDAVNGLALDRRAGVLYTAVNGGRTTPAPAVLKLTGIVPQPG